MSKIPSNEFACNPVNYRFSINPLDMGMAKMQKGLLDALTNDIPETGCFKPVRFEFTSKDPTRLIGDIRLSCEFCVDDDNQRRILLTICAKEQTVKREVELIKDTHQSVLAFAADCGCNGLFAYCKINALWYDKVLDDMQHASSQLYENNKSQITTK